MENNRNNLFKVIFVWGAIIIGVAGAVVRNGWLIIIAAIMIAGALIYVRYFTMKEILNRNSTGGLTVINRKVK